VRRAEEWRWGSLWARCQAQEELAVALSAWPVPIPEDWTERVNAAQTEGELQDLRQCITRGQPFGDSAWVRQTAVKLNLEGTLRPRGRPKKPSLEKGS
jgi:putative transposase